MPFLLAAVTRYVFFASGLGLFVAFLVVGVYESNFPFTSHLALSKSRIVLVVGETMKRIGPAVGIASVTFVIIVVDPFDVLAETSTVACEHERDSQDPVPDFDLQGNELCGGHCGLVSSV